MDEEQSKNKINVNSFFERVDSAEKVASSALTKSDSVMNVANANKLLVQSLQITVEAMQTEIRDIANYIVVENKLEKDLKEDRLLEEQDAQQKKDFEDKLLDLKGPAGPQGPQGVKGEDFGSKGGGGGGSFLGGLLKGLATLGAGAFALKFMWPALLPVVKGAIGGAVSGGVRFLGGAVGKTLIGLLGGIPIVGAAAKLIGGGIERTSSKAADGLEKSIKNMGEDGKINIPTSTGEGGTEKAPQKEEKKENKLMNFVRGIGDSIRNFDGRPGSRETKKVEPEKKENKLFDFVKGGGLAGMAYRKVFGKDEKKETPDKKVSIKQEVSGRFDLETGKAYINGQEVSIDEYTKFQNLSEKEKIQQYGQLKDGDVTGNTPQVEPIIESDETGTDQFKFNTDEASGSTDFGVTFNTTPPTPPPVENSTPLVQAKPPQVSDAEIKITEAPIPFRKLISSKKYLSVSDMPKSGLPPEIAKMIS